MRNVRRVRRADERVLRVVTPLDEAVGYYVRPWRPEMPLRGPLLDYVEALEIALADTAGLVEGAARRWRKEEGER